MRENTRWSWVINRGKTWYSKFVLYLDSGYLHNETTDRCAGGWLCTMCVRKKIRNRSCEDLGLKFSLKSVILNWNGKWNGQEESRTLVLVHILYSRDLKCEIINNSNNLPRMSLSTICYHYIFNFKLKPFGHSPTMSDGNEYLFWTFSVCIGNGLIGSIRIITEIDTYEFCNVFVIITMTKNILCAMEVTAI